MDGGGEMTTASGVQSEFSFPHSLFITHYFTLEGYNT
jgi:hypothetical protein